MFCETVYFKFAIYDLFFGVEIFWDFENVISFYVVSCVGLSSVAGESALAVEFAFFEVSFVDFFDGDFEVDSGSVFLVFLDVAIVY